MPTSKTQQDLSGERLTLILVGDQNFTLVNMSDSDLASFKWNLQEIKCSELKYAVRPIKRNKVWGSELIHRQIMSRVIGRELKRSELVDHRNGDGLDNRRINLRICTHADNMRNRKINKNNTSGYKGVYKRKRSEIWSATIRVDGHTIHLGNFKTAELAYESYCDAAQKHFGEFARI